MPIYRSLKKKFILVVRTYVSDCFIQLYRCSYTRMFIAQHDCADWRETPGILGKLLAVVKGTEGVLIDMT